MRMDVTCEHCEAEYEFDETLLSDKGTTVKCSACAHVFRVMPVQREGGRPPLKLRRAGGGEEQLGSLRELQQRIRDGQAGLDDEIGRDGSLFRRLREVPELKNFFTQTPAPAPAGEAEGQIDGVAAALPAPAALGTTPTARPPAPFHDPAFPAPRAEALAQPGTAQSAAADDKAAKRTMMGVGPLEPPRPPVPVPADDPPTRASEPVSWREPAAAPATAREPATAAAPASPREAATAAAPAPQATVGQSMPTLLGTPARAGDLPGAERPAQPSPVPPSYEAVPASSPATASRSPSGARGPALNPVAPRVPSEERGPAASLPRFEPPGGAADDVAPVARAWAAPVAPPSATAPASWAPKAASAPALVGGAPVRLYLADDEAPPARAMGSSSRLWLVALLLLVGVGGWLGVHALSSSGGDDVPVGRVVPVPAATPPAATAAAPAATPTAVPATPPSNPEPAPKPATEPAGSKPAADKPAKADKPAAAPPGERERASKPAREREPEDYGDLVGKATQLSSKGDHSAAIKTFQAALALRPTGSEANSGLGFALLKANKPNEALPLFDRAASNGFVDANVGLGDAYRKLGQPSSALEAYRTYLEQQPEGSRAAYARTWVEKLDKGGDAPARDPALPPEEREAAPAPREDYRPAGELVPSDPAAPTEAPPAAAGEGSEP